MAFNTCPLPTALTTIPATACPVNFGQIVRALLIRRSAGALFTFTAGVSSIATEATLTAVLADTDSGKGVLTPLFAGLTLPQLDPILEGENDNSTTFGVGYVAGGNVARVQLMFDSISTETADAMQLLHGEALQVVFFNQYGQAILKSNGKGFDIFNQVLGDVTSEGLNRINKTPFSFTLPFGWSKGYKVVNLPYDVLNLAQS
ncbi:hypothetical protein GGR92_005260 [Spirosoma lacussanchae]|uniref:hypothetical protein n=1 Tax=Spirosoma lacussanchae TaxID=1884249 RepID=UPI0011093312|nr:hypothetical protein [Spirosoma lacussanchae]